MKKISIAVVAATLFVSAPALANSGSTTIGGDIAPVCALTQPADTTVALTGTTELTTPLYIICNDPDGFAFSVVSANGFKLLSTNTSSTTAYSYSISSSEIPGFSITSDYSDLTLASADYVAGRTLPITVTILGSSGPDYAGAYRDTLTFTVTAQ